MARRRSPDWSRTILMREKLLGVDFEQLGCASVPGTKRGRADVHLLLCVAISPMPIRSLMRAAYCPTFCRRELGMTNKPWIRGHLRFAVIAAGP